MKVRVQSITKRPTKTGKDRWVVNPESTDTYTVWNETTARILEERTGQEVTADVREDRFGKTIMRVKPVTTKPESPQQPLRPVGKREDISRNELNQLMKKELLSAKQTALNASVSVAAARVTAGMGTPSVDDVKHMANQYYRWLTDGDES